MVAKWKAVCDFKSIEHESLSEFIVDGIEVVVTRVGDEHFVYPLFCPHMDEPLSNGMCDGVTVTCIFHLWQWDMRTGKSTGEAEKDLLIYPSKVEDGNLMVNVENVLNY